MPRSKRKPSKWTSSNESSSDEIKFTSSDEDENKTNQSESKTSGSSGDKPNADEGKASSGEGKTQDTDSLSKTLLQRVTFRMGGTRKQTDNPPPARKNDFSIGQKMWINQRNNKKLARVLSRRVAHLQ